MNTGHPSRRDRKCGRQREHSFRRRKNKPGTKTCLNIVYTSRGAVLPKTHSLIIFPVLRVVKNNAALCRETGIWQGAEENSSAPCHFLSCKMVSFT